MPHVNRREFLPLSLIGIGGLAAAMLLWHNPNRTFDCEAERYFSSINQPDMTAVVLTKDSEDYEYFAEHKHLFANQRYQTSCGLNSHTSLVIWFLEDSEKPAEGDIALVLASRAE